MAHLLVLVVVVASDDRFLITTSMSFAFGGRRISAWQREFLHLHPTTTISYSQRGFTGKEKEFYGKEKEFYGKAKQSKGVWVSIFFQNIVFTHGVLVDFTGKQKA